MADVYELDFLQRIVDVHFGGLWVSVGWTGNAAPLAHPGNCEVDFPDQSGGTPGFILPEVEDGAGPPAGFTPIPFTITKKDFEEGRTNAGLPMPNFGAWNSGHGGNFQLFLGDQIRFFDASRLPQKFHVKMTASGGTGGDAIIALVKPGSMKVGLLTDNLVFVAGLLLTIGGAAPQPKSVTWLVDQTALAVKGPAGAANSF